MYTLCNACGEEADHTKTECNHTEEERSFIWTGWVAELQHALDNGYTAQILEFHHYETSNTLFRTYIARFLRMKLCASKMSDIRTHCNLKD